MRLHQMTLIKSRFIFLLLPIIFVSCSPSIRSLNGKDFSNSNSYILYGDTNLIELRGLAFWKLDTTSLENFSWEKRILKLDPPSTPKRSVSLNFSNSLNKLKKRQINILYGEHPHPIVRYKPLAISDSINFDDLRFFTVFSTSQAGCPIYLNYKIEKMYFSYGSYSYVSNNGKFSSSMRDSIFAFKPTILSIDSVVVIEGVNESLHYMKLDRKINLIYPLENSFKCLDLGKKSHFVFKDILNLDSNKIIILKAEKDCDVIEFSKLGSSSHVSILDKNDKVIFRSFGIPTKNETIFLSHIFTKTS